MLGLQRSKNNDSGHAAKDNLSTIGTSSQLNQHVTNLPTDNHQQLKHPIHRFANRILTNIVYN